MVIQFNQLQTHILKKKKMHKQDLRIGSADKDVVTIGGDKHTDQGS